MPSRPHAAAQPALTAPSSPPTRAQLRGNFGRIDSERFWAASSRPFLAHHALIDQNTGQPPCRAGVAGQPGGYEIPGHFSSGPQRARGIASGSGPGPSTDVVRRAGDSRSRRGTAQIKVPRPVSRCITAGIVGLSAHPSIAKPCGSGVNSKARERARTRSRRLGGLHHRSVCFWAPESSRNEAVSRAESIRPRSFPPGLQSSGAVEPPREKTMPPQRLQAAEPASARDMAWCGVLEISCRTNYREMPFLHRQWSCRRQRAA
jgi:hypothetical protein